MLAAEPGAYTIPDFCKTHHISLPTYYKIKAAGLGPTEMRFGAAVRITREAAAAWRAARSHPVGAEAEAVARAEAAGRRRAQRAARSAVSSPAHISQVRGR
jgi:hypothetical protein